jgi:hypothetical protein
MIFIRLIVCTLVLMAAADLAMAGVMDDIDDLTICSTSDEASTSSDDLRADLLIFCTAVEKGK